MNIWQGNYWLRYHFHSRAIFSQLPFYFFKLHTKNNVDKITWMLIVELLGNFEAGKCQRENPSRRQGLIRGCKLRLTRCNRFLAVWVGFLGLPGLRFIPETVLAADVMFQNAQVCSPQCSLTWSPLSSTCRWEQSKLACEVSLSAYCGNSSQMALDWHLAQPRSM